MPAPDEVDSTSRPPHDETAEDTASTKVGSTKEEPRAEKTSTKEPDETDPDKRKPRADGKVQLKESDCWHRLGYSWPAWKKMVHPLCDLHHPS
jgi:hypothetical protein